MNKFYCATALCLIGLGFASCKSDDSKEPEKNNVSGKFFEENFDGLGKGLSAWTLINDNNKVNDYYHGEYDNAWITKEFGLYNNNHDNKMAVSCSWYEPRATADRWLISPKFKVEGDTPYLYWEECTPDPQAHQTYKVVVSESAGTDKAAFTDVIYQIPEGTNGEIVNTIKSAPLEKYKGKEIRVAFVNTAVENGFLVAIDNIFQSPTKLSSIPYNMTQKLWGTTHSTISWEDYNNTANGNYELSIVKAGEMPGAPGAINMTSDVSDATISGLQPGTRYHTYLRSKGMSHWSGPYPIQTAYNTPYIVDFEGNNLLYKGIFSEWKQVASTPINTGSGLVIETKDGGDYYMKTYSAPIFIQKGHNIKISYDLYTEGKEGSISLSAGSYADGDRGITINEKEFASEDIEVNKVIHVEIPMASVLTDVYRFWITYAAYPSSSFKIYIDNFKVEYDD